MSPSQSLSAFAVAKIAELEALHLKRTLVEDVREDGLWVRRGSQRLLSFACNDYLNLSHHPTVKAAAAEAARRYGVGAGASRLVTGNHPLLGALEQRLAAFKQADACAVFGSGYLANTGVIPTLARPGDLVVIDALAHACLWAGAQLSGARIEPFRHNDVAHAEALLAAHRPGARHALVLTDGVFSMDGDLAPVGALAEVCAAHDAWLQVDDAHGLGVIAAGRGTAALFPGADVPLAMGTLSKALGGYGGYLCAAAPVIDLLKTRARPFVYSTGLPPASAGAALAALEIVAADPALCGRPIANAQRFTKALGLPEAQSAIVPLVLGAPEAALAAQAALMEAGFLVVAIRPPTVPQGAARLRFAFTAGHTTEEIDRLAERVAALPA